ncbi:ABC transporter family substrate-binding protein [Ilumatobacter sp.]|uniref:ABC transporter family substrate-binding protein n=1 Tax=Ilumatobacter sp. TaxID=1967498 RepID=UPI003B51817F
MNTTRRSSKLLAVAAASALVVAACGSDAEESTEVATDTSDTGETGGTEPMTTDGETMTTDGETMTTDGEAMTTDTTGGSGSAGGSGSFAYGNAQEFSNYNNNLGTSNSVKNTIVLNEVQPSPYNFAGPDGGLVLDEELMESVELTSEDPQTIEYVVNPDAAWSDGEPIDCDDFQLQYHANNGAYLQLDDAGEPVTDDSGTELFLFDLVGTTGYEDIDTVECSEDGKTITVTYGTAYADWQSLFDGMVPAHVIGSEAGVDDLLGAFEGDDRESIEAIAETYNTLYTVDPGTIDEATMLSGGPFALGSWEAGQSLTLVPNESYWGTPANGEVVFRYIAEEAQAQALANGEINAMDPQPTPDLLSTLEGTDGVTVENGSQYTWEHFDFNFLNETLQDPLVREAFVKCLPRQQMVDNLIVPLQPEAEVLNNRWVMPFEEGYEDTSGGEYDEVDIEGARALLQEAGQEGLELRIGWFDNGGNQRRTDQVALAVESCNQAGFNMVDAGSETFFDVELAAGDWDIAMFAWAGSPLKSGAIATYQPGSGNNVGSISIPELEPLLAELAGETDPDAQIELANEIDTILWENLATIPVFTFPGVAAYADDAENVIYNPSQNGLTFNASQWQIA